MISFSSICSIIGSVIFAVSSSWYVIDVAKRKVTASIATFFMFSVINISQLVSLVDKRIWHIVPFTAVGTFTSVLICLLALRNKKIYFELPDKIGLVGAVAGFMVWILTGNAAFNIYIISIVNVIVFAPLIIKSFKHPDLETRTPWAINLLASLFLMLTINSGALVVWIIPVRQFLCSALLNIGLFKGSLNKKFAVR